MVRGSSFRNDLFQNPYFSHQTFLYYAFHCHCPVLVLSIKSKHDWVISFLSSPAEWVQNSNFVTPTRSWLDLEDFHCPTESITFWSFITMSDLLFYISGDSLMQGMDSNGGHLQLGFKTGLKLQCKLIAPVISLYAVFNRTHFLTNQLFLFDPTVEWSIFN